MQHLSQCFRLCNKAKGITLSARDVYTGSGLAPEPAVTSPVKQSSLPANYRVHAYDATDGNARSFQCGHDREHDQAWCSAAANHRQQFIESAPPPPSLLPRTSGISTHRNAMRSARQNICSSASSQRHGIVERIDVSTIVPVTAIT